MRFALPVVAVGVLFGLALVLSGARSPSRPAPPLPRQALVGSPASLSTLHGRPALIDCVIDPSDGTESGNIAHLNPKGIKSPTGELTVAVVVSLKVKVSPFTAPVAEAEKAGFAMP